MLHFSHFWHSKIQFRYYFILFSGNIIRLKKKLLKDILNHLSKIEQKENFLQKYFFRILIFSHESLMRNQLFFKSPYRVKKYRSECVTLCSRSIRIMQGNAYGSRTVRKQTAFVSRTTQYF